VFEIFQSKRLGWGVAIFFGLWLIPIHILLYNFFHTSPLKLGLYSLGVTAIALIVWIKLVQANLLSLFHNEMNEIVQDLALKFQEVGYSLSYEKQSYHFSHLAFIRFYPCTASSKKIDGDEDFTDPGGVFKESLNDDIHHDEQQAPFQVAFNGYGSITNHSFFKGYHSRTYDDVNNSVYRTQLDPERIDTLIDEFTWGAVSTELRPWMWTAHAWDTPLNSMAFIVASHFGVLFTLAHLYWPDSYLIDIRVFLLMSYVVLHYVTVVSVMFLRICFGCCFECRRPNVLLNNRHEIEEKLSELSPLVEERSGYRLELFVDGRAGFVRFWPTDKSHNEDCTSGLALVTSSFNDLTCLNTNASADVGAGRGLHVQ
jgi:hypothetical protein